MENEIINKLIVLCNNLEYMTSNKCLKDISDYLSTLMKVDTSKLDCQYQKDYLSVFIQVKDKLWLEVFQYHELGMKLFINSEYEHNYSKEELLTIKIAIKYIYNIFRIIKSRRVK